MFSFHETVLLINDKNYVFETYPCFYHSLNLISPNNEKPRLEQKYQNIFAELYYIDEEEMVWRNSFKGTESREKGIF